MKAFYQSSLQEFKRKDSDEIIGTIVTNSNFDDTQSQKKAWETQISLLKGSLSSITNAELFFEYTIPRIGKRIDNILIYKGIIFLLEFKVGAKNILQQDLDQIEDYALDLKNFHEMSHSRIIVPILIATNALIPENQSIQINTDNVYNPITCSQENLAKTINQISEQHHNESSFNADSWSASRYYPTPTIIEAAQALYNGHNVQEISRSEAGAINLSVTTQYVNKVIDDCKKHHKKAICFITGVPGAGKTLAGLNIANERQSYKEEELTTFLSGNGPLVDVLREALTRDKVLQTGIRKKDAEREVNSFIQNIHHFRDDSVKREDAPPEKVIIFDEAQRAWNIEKTSNFMNTKRNQSDFNQSEPEFLINVMDRHQDWAVIICLIGEGQEINDGEAGLSEWFSALQSFPEWDIYTPNHQFLKNAFPNPTRVTTNSNLHLALSIRAFRSEQLSAWVSAVLERDYESARNLLTKIDQYPIVITRSLDQARNWLRNKARGTERSGLLASSGARRLKKEGIYVQREFKAVPWFLNDKEDVRSSYFLEEVATEFDIQGLEIDWACLAWDLDLRIDGQHWEYKNFVGTKWNNINKEVDQDFKKNAYRVLLTRARQGMVLYIPLGDNHDHTRNPKEYEAIYSYLKSLGLPEL